MAKNEIYQFYVEGEDEKKIIETLTDYKRDLIKCSNLNKKLQEKEFDIAKMWNKTPPIVLQSTVMIQI